MSVHTIRLRAGWLWWVEDAAPESAERVDLPAAWINGYDQAIRLARSFQSPPLEVGRERLELRLGAVPGLAEVRLNDRPLATAVPTDGGPIVVPLPVPLRPRNRLELRVKSPGWHQGADARPPWGEVALVIQRDGPALGEPSPL